MSKVLNNVPYVPDFSKVNPQEVIKSLEKIREAVERFVTRDDRSKVSLQDIIKLEKACQAIESGLQKHKKESLPLAADFQKTFQAIERLKQAKIDDMRG